MASQGLPYSAGPGERPKWQPSTVRWPTTMRMVAPVTTCQPATGGGCKLWYWAGCTEYRERHCAGRPCNEGIGSIEPGAIRSPAATHHVTCPDTRRPGRAMTLKELSHCLAPILAYKSVRDLTIKKPLPLSCSDLGIQAWKDLDPKRPSPFHSPTLACKPGKGRGHPMAHQWSSGTPSGPAFPPKPETHRVNV